MRSVERYEHCIRAALAACDEGGHHPPPSTWPDFRRLVNRVLLEAELFYVLELNAELEEQLKRVQS